MRPSPAAGLARKQGALRLSQGVVLAQLRAQAARWGEHGFFRIEDGETTQGVAYCQLKAEAGIDGGTFSLVLRWLPSGQLQAFFVSGYGLVQRRTSYPCPWTGRRCCNSSRRAGTGATG